MGLKGRLKHLQKVARGELESFPLLDGTLYFYDRLESAKDLFLHIYDCRLGRDAEPPEVLRYVCRAKEPEAVLERFLPKNPSQADMSLADIYDVDVLANERRLARIRHAPPEDLS